jgi:uncharacterized metal-binding protein YceD (DUF177 family)
VKDFSPPFRHIFDLGDLSLAGSVESVVVRDAADLARLAEWADVAEIKRFGAVVNLRRVTQNRFAFEADLEADIVQSCVVTLEPVPAHLTRHFARELQLATRARSDEGELTLAAGDDDVPEVVTSLDYDLAAPLLEEFVLAIDPYPRKAGAAFAPPPEASEAPESPFAVLKSLKDEG